MILVKNKFLFLWPKILERMFGDVLDRKQAFLGSKNISFFPVAKLDVS